MSNSSKIHKYLHFSLSVLTSGTERLSQIAHALCCRGNQTHRYDAWLKQPSAVHQAIATVITVALLVILFSVPIFPDTELLKKKKKIRQWHKTMGQEWQQCPLPACTAQMPRRGMGRGWDGPERGWKGDKSQNQWERKEIGWVEASRSRRQRRIDQSLS